METQDKYELIIIRTKYLKNTLKLTSKIAEQAHQMFTKYLNIKMGTEKRQSRETNHENQEHQIQKNIKQTKQHKEEPEERVEFQREEKDKNLKKVFRKVALQIHPDKLTGKSQFEKQIKKTLFEKAREALQKNDYYGMIEVAEELGIDIPAPTQEQIELMKVTNKNLEKQIDVLKRSVVWGWYHADQEIEKEKIMDRYIDYLKKNNTGT